MNFTSAAVATPAVSCRSNFSNITFSPPMLISSFASRWSSSQDSPLLCFWYRRNGVISIVVEAYFYIMMSSISMAPIRDAIDETHHSTSSIPVHQDEAAH